MRMQALAGALLIGLFLAIAGLCLATARAGAPSIPIGTEVGSLAFLLRL